MHHLNQYTTDNLLLRALNRNDLEALHAAISQSSDTVGKWLDWCKPEFTESDARIWINESRQAWFAGRFYEFAVIEKSTNELIGCMCIHSIERNSNLANLGYWLMSKHQGKGYGLEGAQKTIWIAFHALRLTRMEIIIHPDNIGSQTIAKKLNAQFEIIARNRFIFHGKPTDGMVWSLIPSDIGYEPPEPVPPTNTADTEQNKTANTESVAPEAETKPNDANSTS